MSIGLMHPFFADETCQFGWVWFFLINRYTINFIQVRTFIHINNVRPHYKDGLMERGENHGNTQTIFCFSFYLLLYIVKITNPNVIKPQSLWPDVDDFFISNY